MSSIEIGKRVNQVRDSAGLNQRDFAARLETSSGYISGVESGKTMPGGEFLLRLNHVFGADVTWVIAGKKDGAVIPLGTVLTAEEQVLVDGYRGLDAPTRKRMMAFLFSGETPPAKMKKQVNVSASGGQAAGRNIVNKGGKS